MSNHLPETLITSKYLIGYRVFLVKLGRENLKNRISQQLLVFGNA